MCVNFGNLWVCFCSVFILYKHTLSLIFFIRVWNGVLVFACFPSEILLIDSFYVNVRDHPSPPPNRKRKKKITRLRRSDSQNLVLPLGSAIIRVSIIFSLTRASHLSKVWQLYTHFSCHQRFVLTHRQCSDATHVSRNHHYSRAFSGIHTLSHSVTALRWEENPDWESKILL